MPKITQPGTQIKLTNVSLVRMKKDGKRFEIACYKNKVSEFRSGVETDMSEILQIEQVFTNVTKGQVAKPGDWQKAFGTEDINKVIEEILRKGDLQINSAERDSTLHSLSREIATLVSDLTVDPKTNVKHTVGMVEKAMTESGFSIRTDRPAKAQALELIKKLSANTEEGGTGLAVRRVRMRVRISMPGKDARRIKERVMEEVEEVEEEEMGVEWEAIVQIAPSAFRTLTDMIGTETKGKGRVESMGNAGG